MGGEGETGQTEGGGWVLFPYRTRHREQGALIRRKGEAPAAPRSVCASAPVPSALCPCYSDTSWLVLHVPPTPVAGLGLGAVLFLLLLTPLCSTALLPLSLSQRPLLLLQWGYPQVCHLVLI